MLSLATLACKNAIVERDVAHLIFPDDVQTLPAGDAKAGSRLPDALSSDRVWRRTKRKQRRRVASRQLRPGDR